MNKPSFYIAKALKALSSAHNRSRGEEKGSKFLTSVRNFMVNINFFSEIVCNGITKLLTSFK